MSVTITDDDAARVADCICRWRKNLEAHHIDGDTAAESNTRLMLLGVEYTLQAIGLTELARRAKDARTAPIITGTEATK